MFNEKQLQLIKSVFSQMTFKPGSSEPMKEVEGILAVTDDLLSTKGEPVEEVKAEEVPSE